MNIVFISSKKKKFYIETIYKLVSNALNNYDFDLVEDGANLMSDICGLDGLNYSKQMCEKQIKELEKELEMDKKQIKELEKELEVKEKELESEEEE